MRKKEVRRGSRKRSLIGFIVFFFSLGISVLLWNWYRYSKLAYSIEGIFEEKIKHGHKESLLESEVLDVGVLSNQKAGMQQNQHLSTASKNPLIKLSSGPVFYNIFVPDTRVLKTKEIITEQLDEYRFQFDNATLLYTLIANNHADAIQRLIGSICHPPMICTERERLSKGNEENTLQALWEYCSLETTASTNEDDTVVTYIHDKGSFHASLSNVGARKRGTRCALSCRQQMIQKPRMCNICTSVFQVIPQYHGSAK